MRAAKPGRSHRLRRRPGPALRRRFRITARTARGCRSRRSGRCSGSSAHRLAKLGLPPIYSFVRPRVFTSSAGAARRGSAATRGARPHPASGRVPSRQWPTHGRRLRRHFPRARPGPPPEHVEVGEVDEVRRQRPSAVVRVGAHDDDPREVDAGQGSEVDHLAVGDPLPSPRVNRSARRRAVPTARDDARRADSFGVDSTVVEVEREWRSFDRSHKTAEVARARPRGLVADPLRDDRRLRASRTIVSFSSNQLASLSTLARTASIPSG